MKKRSIVPLLLGAVLLAACGEETRNGQLSLTGSQPVRVVDQGGAAVDFVSGPLKVTFGVDGRKFTVELEQSGRKAKFAGNIPGGAQDWNVAIKGGDIGQPVDLTSRRSVALYGPVWTTWGMGDPCGMNGRWETEESWQKGREDWSVSFADAGTGKTLGAFASQKDQDYRLSSRNTWCRERPMPEPRGPHGRWNSVAQRLDGFQLDGVRFDSR